jgi:hypothetical protein
MNDQDYPSLFQGADAASVLAQKTYFVLQQIYLGSLIVGGIIGMFASLCSGSGFVWMYTTMAIVFAIGFLVLWIGRSRRDDQAWFDCRAVAESVKTATWRFMMVAPPFLYDDTADQRFVAELQEILTSRPESQDHLAGATADNYTAITNFMRQKRSRSFEDRKLFYVEQRLRKQKAWYSSKAHSNSHNGTVWFWVMVGFQAITVILAIIKVAVVRLEINIVPFLTTCAATVAAWTQMKRHGELKKTYAITAQELAELEVIANDLTAETDFPQLVEQVEEAISREHTMWCARRDVMLRRTDSGSRTRKTV